MHKHPTFTESQPRGSAEQMKQRFSGYSEHYFPQPALTQNPPPHRIEVGEKPKTENKMSEVSREELAARLETIEVRMDGRVASIEAKIDGFIGRLDERFGRMDDRIQRIEAASSETQASLKGMKSTIIITAVSTVLAIVIGVATFNATVLSSMVASFESGKNTAAVQAEVKRQSEETAALLKQMQRDMSTAKK